MYIPNVQSILAAGLALTGVPELMKKRESILALSTFPAFAAGWLVHPTFISTTMTTPLIHATLLNNATASNNQQWDRLADRFA